MAQDTRLARVLHVLIHMHLRGGSTTSETLALMLQTHAVVVRRTMATLREAGLVNSVGGRNGGWSLARELSDFTAGDVYGALEHAGTFSFGLAADNPSCPVEGAVNRFIAAAQLEAEQVLMQRLGDRALSELAKEISPQRAAGPRRARR